MTWPEVAAKAIDLAELVFLAGLSFLAGRGLAAIWYGRGEKRDK